MHTDTEGIAQREKQADAFLATRELSVHSSALAAWLLITVTDDVLWSSLKQCDCQFDLVQFVSRTDEYKYGLKNALHEMANRKYSDTHLRIPKAIKGGHYLQAARMLRAGIAYEMARICFSGYHAGMVECKYDGNRLYFPPHPTVDIRMRAREMLEATAGANSPDASPLLRMVDWGRTGAPQQLSDYASSSAKRIGDCVFYSNTEVGDRIVHDLLDSQTGLIPDGWICSWGDKNFIASSLRAILAIHALHFLVVQLASDHRIGGCIPSRALVIRKGDLVARIASLTGHQRQTIASLVDALTYGVGAVSSPDPALQPFYHLQDDLLCSAPMLVCSSNLERNILTLAARLDPRKFNAESSAFERMMTASIKASLDTKGWTVLYNRQIPCIRSAGEIDCLIFDTVDRVILLLELWWQIPAAETREVMSREKTAAEKAAKAERKLAAVRAKTADILRYAQLRHEGDWTARALLVSESFCPRMRASGEVSYITRRAAQALLGEQDRLSAVITAVDDSAWLPVERRHFHVDNSEVRLGKIQLSITAVTPKTAGVLFADRTSA